MRNTFLGWRFPNPNKDYLSHKESINCKYLKILTSLKQRLLMDPPNFHLSQDSGTNLSLDEASCYQRLIGRFLHLQISQPYISFSVHCLSQVLQKSTTQHMNVAHHILRHLKKAPIQVVLLKPTSNFQPKSFVDANWGACACGCVRYLDQYRAEV